MHPAQLGLDLGHHIHLGRVQRHVGTQGPRQRQLVLGNVHRHHMQAHRLGILHRHMPQPPDAADRHPLPGAGLGLLQALVDGHAGAQHRRGGAPVKALGQPAHIIRLGPHELRIAAVHRVAGHLLALAQRLPAAHAMRAAPAGRVQPGRAHPVALLQMGDARAHGGHLAHALMPRDEGGGGLHRPVAHRGMQVGVADPACPHPDQDLPGPHLRHRHLAYLQGRAKARHHGGLHRLRQGHRSSPSARFAGIPTPMRRRVVDLRQMQGARVADPPFAAM